MMDHKAYLLDFDAFDQELRPILEGALRTGDVVALVSFINAHLSELRDPYEGYPLGPDWEAMLESKDAHQYGDFALTKYYDPAAELGLGPDWDGLETWFLDDLHLTDSPILGEIAGPPNAPFDPGKMGSYFQSAQQVRQNLSQLLTLAQQAQREDLQEAIQMLRRAVKANRGLYVTF